jgi:hypothetical protein
MRCKSDQPARMNGRYSSGLDLDGCPQARSHSGPSAPALF